MEYLLLMVLNGKANHRAGVDIHVERFSTENDCAKVGEAFISIASSSSREYGKYSCIAVLPKGL